LTEMDVERLAPASGIRQTYSKLLGIEPYQRTNNIIALIHSS
jgi:hypothetical protein